MGFLVGVGVLFSLILLAILFVIAAIAALVMLAIQFWYITLPIIGIIILISNRQKIRDWQIEQQAIHKREEFYRQYHSRPKEEPREKNSYTHSQDYGINSSVHDYNRDPNSHSNYQHYQKKEKSSKNEFYNDIFGGSYDYKEQFENEKEQFENEKEYENDEKFSNEEFFKNPFGENNSKNEETFDEVYDRIGNKFIDSNEISLENAFELLNLNNDSTIQEIKDKFRELVLRYHPDKCKNVKDVEEKFKAIYLAYEVILDNLEIVQ